jgi:hypothetical protein
MLKLLILHFLVFTFVVSKPFTETEKKTLELIQIKNKLNQNSLLKGTASLTYYHSYAPCCKNNPNYDPNFDKSECTDFSACKYSGDFAAIGHKSFDWVKKNNIVAFYDDSDPEGKNFKKKYGGKTIKLIKNGKTFNAIIADTCGNKDCNDCCRKNSKPSGYLVDIEYHTAIRNLGNINSASGQISFVIVDTPGQTTTTPESSCRWRGHCLGDPCKNNNDCDGDLVCLNKKCSKKSQSSCSWRGHCAGDPCKTFNDCDGSLTCKNGRCG